MNLHSLKADISHCLKKDQHPFTKQWHKLKRSSTPSLEHFHALEQSIQQSKKLVQKRKQRIEQLKIRLPESLPITSRKDEILDAVKNHQVTVITGETGSGKTTQLPKMALLAGQGSFGNIACTQPRRIAATSLAQRVSEELNIQLGAEIGYSIRFAEQTSENTLVTFMTDGILLAEIQTDPWLNRYDTIILDEAHERSLNIDFLLGYLRHLIQKRKDLKIIITSATIDVEKFSQAFSWTNENGQSYPAPIIEVSGRMFPVELRYHPIDEIQEEKGELSMNDMVRDAVEEVITEPGDGNILVFMSGSQEIKEARDSLVYLEKEGFEVLPLFGRLSQAEQNRIFHQDGKRKIILSTNIAETSLTIPGIQYVVDTGRARISRYYPRTGTQGLPVEKISKSSAEQRKGRCGRVRNGICIRLYTEEDFVSRLEHTPPEIQRSNLAEVILKMKYLKLGNISDFAFIDPPDASQIRNGFRILQELGALDDKKNLTRDGREMAGLPVDPRTGRMILQAKKENVLYPVLILAAGISCQDPREYPEDKKSQAQQKHARFKSDSSDLMSLLKLWEEFHDKLDELKTQNKIRKFCKSNFLSYRKIREWRDIHRQLAELAREKKWSARKPDNWDYDAIHQSILAGYLSHIAHLKEKKEYEGTRNRLLTLFPGSGQYRNRHEWLVALEIMETSKLFAMNLAKIEPDWIENLAEHLISKSWSEPRWDAKQSSVVAWEKVSLFGLTIVPQRKVQFGKINRELSHEVFIREALVEEKLISQLPFWIHNQQLLEDLENREKKLRKKNILIDDILIEAFYVKQLAGFQVASIHDLQKIIRKKGGDSFLKMTEQDVLKLNPDNLQELYPDTLKLGKRICRYEYEFDPDKNTDGVTLHIPKELVNSLKQESFEYLVPGLLIEKIVWLLKALPKPQRRKLVPIQDTAEKIWDEMTGTSFSTGTSEKESETRGNHFYQDLSDILFEQTRVHVKPEEWQVEELPEYLKIKFAVTTGKNQIRISTDLASLQLPEKKKKDDWKLLVKPFEQHDITKWNFGSLIEPVRINPNDDLAIYGYRTLEKVNQKLVVTLKKDPLESKNTSIQALKFWFERLHQDAFNWLYGELRFPPETLQAIQRLEGSDEQFMITALQNKLGNKQNKVQAGFHHLIQDRVYQMVVSGICGYHGNDIWTEKSFYKRSDSIEKELQNLGTRTVDWIRTAFTAREEAKQLAAMHIKQPEIKSISEEMNKVITAASFEDLLFDEWKHLSRIFSGYLKRIEKCLHSPENEIERKEIVQPLEQQIHELWNHRKEFSEIQIWAIKRIRWMLNEWKVSVFSQELKTAMPVSEKRIQKLINQYFSDSA